MECKGRRTMKRCVSLRGRRNPPPPPPPLPLGWYIPDQFAEEEPPNITPDLWNSQAEKSSSGSSPCIKMTKQRTPPPKKTTKMKSNERSENA